MPTWPFLADGAFDRFPDDSIHVSFQCAVIPRASKPARSDSVETRFAFASGTSLLANVTLFETGTRDEIVTLPSVGGRASTT